MNGTTPQSAPQRASASRKFIKLTLYQREREGRKEGNKSSAKEMEFTEDIQVPLDIIPLLTN